MTTQLPQWHAFKSTNAIGDPGRQPEIRPSNGPLTVGVPDTALDFLTAVPFEIRACSSRGWSHRYQGTPRQDSYSLLVRDDVIAVAVADGVSQGEHSQVAAETAARSACKLVVDQLDRNRSVDWVRLSRRVSLRIVEEAEYRRILTPTSDEPTDEERLRACLAVMASTLIVAVIERTPTHAGYRAQIAVVAGDSAAYILTDRSMLPAGGGKDETETISSTSVHPLPGPVTPKIRNILLQPGQGLVLGTDGLGDPVGDGSGDVGRELGYRWQHPPTIDSFLLDVNAYRRTFDDDRTAVAIWLNSQAVLPEPPTETSSGLEAAASDDKQMQVGVSAPNEDEPPSERTDSSTELPIGVVPVAKVAPEQVLVPNQELATGGDPIGKQGIC